MEFEYLIIGGGLAGTTAAETIRKEEPNNTIGIVSDEPYHLYSRIMLSKGPYFLDKVPEERIWLKRDEWYKDNKIEFVGGKKAIGINAEQKTITLDDDSVIKYKKLLLAPGATPREWKVPGSEKNGVYCLRTLDHSKAIKRALPNTKRAVAIGGGIISLEITELLKESGIEVITVIRGAHYMGHILDETSALIVEETVQKYGIKIIKNAEVINILGSEKVEGVELSNGEHIDCEMIICGIGVVLEKDWLEQSGIEVRRGIIADEYLKTNKEDIWTAGDAAEFKDLILEETAQFGSWINAREQGKTAGLNMVGKTKPFRFVSYYNVVAMGMSICFVGDVRLSDDRQIITRGSRELGWIVRFLLVNNELVGATLLNKPNELMPIVELTKNNVNLSGKEAQLQDPNTDLKTLL